MVLPHTRSLLRFARRLTGELTTAEDVVQEALLQAWRSFHQFQPGTNARAWLFRIVANTWFGWSRKESPLKAKIQAMPPDDGRQSTPYETLEISQALDQLPEEQRSVIVLVVVEGFTCRETGEILGIPMGTVMSRLSRARQVLREKLAVSGKEQVTR